MTVSKNTVNAAIVDHGIKALIEALVGVDTIAAAGSTIADATPINGNRVVVTASNDAKGVRLPVAERDASVTIVNTVSNKTLLVYPATATEQVNAVTAGDAYTMPAATHSTFYCDATGHWYVAAGADISGVTASSDEINVLTGVTAGTAKASAAAVLGASKNLDTLLVALFGFGSAGIENTLTAGAGGTQASGSLALSATKSVHRFTIVATTADSAILPAATGSGTVHVVINDDLSGATSMQLFAAATETIDDITSATGVAIAATKRRILIDTAAGKWTSILGA